MRLYLSDVVRMILKIEDVVRIPIVECGLYDTHNKEYINIENEHKNYDYHHSYESMSSSRYTHDEELSDDFDDILLYLLNHNGVVVFTMFNKGSRGKLHAGKCYRVEYDLDKLYAKYVF